jgi:predicted Rossmann-fold nucleotide-binding protein
MAKMLVIGSLELTDPARTEFLKSLGAEIAEEGHHLLNGCRNDLDKIVAQGASERLKAKGRDPAMLITCYVSGASRPVHDCGTILKSRCPNWESLASPGLEVPETVEQTDVVIVIGGTVGTECAANWARIAQKPIVPVATFGGSAARIYDEELRTFADKYADRLDRSEYELLNQIPSDAGRLARDTVSLAARAITSRHVFVAMSFANDPKFDDAYESIQTVCHDFHYEARRISGTDAMDRIVPEIISGIRKSAFVIVDVSEERPNVYYELGFAQGAGKRVIVTATKGTKLPFDISDIAVIFWEGQKQLKDRLRERIAATQGR